MSEYANHYLLTSPNVQTGGEMDAFFSVMRDKNGKLFRVADADPKYLQVSYVYPPYNSIDSRYTFGNKIVLVARFRTGMDNPYANAPVYRAQEWSSLNPGRKVWTNTQGDVRPVPITPPEADPLRQGYLDQVSADLINQAVYNAYLDYVETYVDEAYKLMVIGFIIYYLTEQYENALAIEADELNQLKSVLPYFTPPPMPAYYAPISFKFVSFSPEITEQMCIEDFLARFGPRLRDLAKDTKVYVTNESVCLLAKDPASEQKIYNYAYAELPYMVAATVDEYCNLTAPTYGGTPFSVQ